LPALDALAPLLEKSIAVGMILYFIFFQQKSQGEVIRQLQLNTRATTLMTLSNPYASGAVKAEAQAILQESEKNGSSK